MTTKRHAHPHQDQVATDKCSRPIMQLKYIAIFEKMGKQLSINPLFIMSTALQESGWDLAHVFGTNSSSNGKPLNNLFGMTRHGGNNLAYPSVEASANAWIADWGSYLASRPTTIDGYAAALNNDKKHMYNADPGYPAELAKRYKQLDTALAACGINFRERMMSRTKHASTFILLAMRLIAGSRSASAQAQSSPTCNQATMIKPQVGVAYSGKISVEDYKFHARIPEGLTGWSGVASDAPFHGFAIFLDASNNSCIIFEVHLRIDDDEVPPRPRTAKSSSLGNAKAWQITDGTHNRIKSRTNVTTYFSFKQNGQTDDGKVVLISPPEELQKTRSIYDAFLRSLSFRAATSF